MLQTNLGERRNEGSFGLISLSFLKNVSVFIELNMLEFVNIQKIRLAYNSKYIVCTQQNYICLFKTHCNKRIIFGRPSGARTGFSKVMLSSKGFFQPREQILILSRVC